MQVSPDQASIRIGPYGGSESDETELAMLVSHYEPKFQLLIVREIILYHSIRIGWVVHAKDYFILKVTKVILLRHHLKTLCWVSLTALMMRVLNKKRRKT